MQELLKKLNKLQITVAIKDDRLDIKAPKGAMTQELLVEIKQHKEELLIFLKTYQTKKNTIKKTTEKAEYILSSSQYRLWLLQELEKGNTTYNMPSAFSIQGNLDITILKEAFLFLLKRHEILRTNFEWNSQINAPVQKINPYDEVNFPFQYIDLSNQTDQETIIKQKIKTEVAYVFELKKECLLRVTVIQTESENYILIFVVHHIISDGWSSGIIIKDIFEYYQTLLKKEPITVVPLDIQYKDYAVWQQKQLQSPEMELHKNYWVSLYKSGTTNTELPTSFSRPTIKTYNGNTVSEILDIQNFEALCKAQNVTLFMGVTALLKTLFYKYTGKTYCTIGSPISGRTEAELTNLVGFFVNTFGIHTDLVAKDSFVELLQKVKLKTLEAFEHQEYPFDALINELGISDRSRNPLFDVIVSIVESKNELIPQNEKLKVTEILFEETTSKFDLEFVLNIQSENTVLKLTYNTDIYSEGFILQMIKHFRELMQNILAAPKTPLDSLRYMTDSESKKIRFKFNQKIEELPRHETFSQAFHRGLQKFQNETAIVDSEIPYTYLTINNEATKFANYLQELHGVVVQDFIGVNLPRGKALIITFLALQKIGAVYVPVDSNYPQERIDFIVQDSQAKYMIDEAFLSKFEASEFDNGIEISAHQNPQDLAYMIYTSGSTGMPKGVMITHENVLNFAYWYIDFYGISTSSRITSYSGIAFDASLMQITPNLLSGSTLYPIKDADTRLNSSKLHAFLTENKITHSYLPTVVCQEFVRQKINLPNIKILTGGDSLQLQEQPNFLVYDNYGPTECAIVSTAVNVKTPNASNIGKPIYNTHVYILDKNHQLCPIGIPGELYVSGKGVAKGYWNRLDLTKEKFIDNPFESGMRMYATGDLGKWLPDGNIIFLGRKDYQIQLRGYRIELGEIEHAITNFSKNIHQVTVIVKEEHLIAYFTGEENTIDTEALAVSLQQTLPSYMLPSHFVKLEVLPLTPNGKVNRKQLQKLSVVQTKTVIAASNSIEKSLVTIWKTLLNVENVSVVDDFFMLGGHSLLLMKLMAKYQEVFKISLSLSSLYENTLLENHAQLLAQEKQQILAIPQLEVQSHYDVSATQLRYWLIDKIKGKSKEFNITNTFKLPENIDRNLLEKALSKLITRHETLRTTFIDVAGIPKQKIHETNECTLQYVASETAAKLYAFDHVFELNTYPLFRISVTDQQLYFNIHHSICDGWSVHVLYRDLMTFYQVEKAQQELSLPVLPIQYKEYAAWQKEKENSEGFQYQKKYWEKQLQQPLAYLQLPTDYSETVQTNASVYTVAIRTELQEKIIKLSQKEGVSLFATFMATFKILLYKLTYEKDSIVGIPVANRNHYQLNDLAGCFLNTLMLRDTIDEEFPFQTWVQKVHQTLTKGLTHQSYPFENLLENLQLKQTDKFPISPIFLNMVDFDEVKETLTSFDTHSESLGVPPKFDLECYIKSFTNGFTIDCVYDSHLFSKETITLWMNTYIDILDQVTEEIKKPIAEISTFKTLTPFTQELPQNNFKVFEAEEVHQSIIARFEKQVDVYSDKIAVVANDEKFTYRTINTCANQLAQQINDQTQKTKRIALLLPHNETSVIGMLGVLKSGYSYVPIDLENPTQRIQFILKDAQCNILIYEETTEEKAFLQKNNNPTLVLIKLSVISQPITIPNPVIKTKPKDEAYVLYTSGSTGNPKGVIQIQKNVLHYIRVYTNNVAISNTDILSVFSTYSFDASVKDIYGAILNGAILKFYYIPEKGLTDLSDWIRREQVSIIHMVPTIYRYFMSSLQKNEILETVRLVDLGGEASYKSDFELFKKHFPKTAFLVNDYGPTEATIVSQYFLNHNSEVYKNDLHLGAKVLETEISIVDMEQNEVKTYQEGEIMFTSEYLSLGYLNLEEKTKEVFTQERSTSEKRSYRSGDLGKKLPNGTIEFLGRKDSQVKINGLRIELSEIEYQVVQLNNVTKTIVLLQTLEQNQYITCYYTGEEIDSNLFKTTLKDRLPNYMIPAIYVQLSIFPETRTGKIDRKALPIPKQSDLKTEAYKAPESDIEKELVTIWSSQLRVDSKSLGILDNFFEIGGNSLQVVTIINTINKTYDTALSIESLYETLTIKELSEVVNFSVQQKQQNNDILEDMDEIIL